MPQNPDHETMLAYVRKRPRMFLGNEGLRNLFREWVFYAMARAQTDALRVEITILPKRHFEVAISSDQDLTSLAKYLQTLHAKDKTHFPYLLHGLLQPLEPFRVSPQKLALRFTLHEALHTEPPVDFLALTEGLINLAVVYRSLQVILRDERATVPSQLYLHFPQGVSYLVDRAMEPTIGRSDMRFEVDETIDDLQIQVCLGFRTDWAPEPYVVSYGNHRKTTYGGSLVDGVLAGFTAACRTWINQQGWKGYRVRQRDLYNGLILACAVRGEDLEFHGSFGEILKTPAVEEISRKLVRKQALAWMREHPEWTTEFVRRFKPNRLKELLTRRK